jgi:hypothetical protein
MTSVIVDSSKPCALEDAKASSRFGPSVPFDPASASVWQVAHWLCGARKSSLPRLGSPSLTRLTAPHPAAEKATTRAASMKSEFRSVYEDG